jgi:hypothetical protein
MENMYGNMQHGVVCMTHVGTFPFTLMAFKPYKYRKPLCVPTEAKPGILITRCPDNRIPLQPLCYVEPFPIRSIHKCNVPNLVYLFENKSEKIMRREEKCNYIKRWAMLITVIVFCSGANWRAILRRILTT